MEEAEANVTGSVRECKAQPNKGQRLRDCPAYLCLHTSLVIFVSSYGNLTPMHTDTTL